MTGKSVVKTTNYVGFNVHTRSYINVTREYDPTDYYSGEDTQTSWDIDSVEAVSTNPEFAAKFSIVHGHTYYLLYGIYSTGDSFSHEESGRFESIEIYKSHKQAQRALNQLQQHYDLAKGRNFRPGKERPKRPRSFSEHSCKILGGDGKTLTFAVPWTGYFESLNCLDIYPFVIR